MGPTLILLSMALAGWLAGFAVLGRILLRHAAAPMPDQAQQRVDTTALSLIIPARNEEKTLPRLLGSLAGQSVRPREIIVVDDHSTDRTAEVAQEWGAKVLASQPLPEGWRGKTWACRQGAGLAAGDMFLFLDADTWFEPQGLQLLLASYVEGVLSVGPYHAVQRPYEQLSAFFNLVMAGGTGAFVLWGGQPRGLFGQVLLVRREDYEKVHGHESVKGRILENFYLAERFRQAGIPMQCVVGQGLCALQMYPDGPQGMIAGWTKGFASGAAQTPWLIMVLIVVWMGGLLLGPFLLATGWLGCAIYLLFAAQLYVLWQRIGAFYWYTALLFPIPLVFYFLVFAWAVLRSGKTVSWKGRKIHAD